MLPSATLRGALMGLLALALGTTATPSPQTTSGTTTQACNNSPLLCDRAYNNVTFMGAHDSSFLRNDATTSATITGELAGNQFLNATKALSAGLRLLQVQVHLEGGQLVMCHTNCAILNSGPLSTWLTRVREWMDENPNEVVSIVLVNASDQPASAFAAAYQTAGLVDYGFVPTSTSATTSWPSLRSMIQQGNRLVSYVASITYDATYPYLLPQFAYIFETPFEVTALTDFVCTLDRPATLAASGASGAISNGYMGMVNHFAYNKLTDSILVPDVGDIEITNDASTTSAGMLGTHWQKCQNEWGIRPNMVLVDFWDEGDVLVALDQANGVTGQTTGRTAISVLQQAEDDGGNGGTSAATGVLVGKGHAEFGALVAVVAAGVFMF